MAKHSDGFHAYRFALTGISPKGKPSASGPRVSQARYIRWLLDRIAFQEQVRQRALPDSRPVPEAPARLRLSVTKWTAALRQVGIAPSDWHVDVTCERFFQVIPPPDGGAFFGNEIVLFWDLEGATAVLFVGREHLSHGRIFGTIETPTADRKKKS
ncbi:MAG TPA: hypothetical protein VHD85_04840 [Terracidiphilus sp.]|nr:hypothetical protein [Terracidiphilus sp.]